MALDFCFDVKTFLKRTCRACSRYFSDEVVFHDIFKSVDDTEEQHDKGDVPSDEIKEIYEELNIWKLNIRPNDGLPQQICEECMERFRSVRLFREECLDTQKVLQSYFLDFDALLETGSLGKLTPRAESIKTEAAASPAPSSFNAEDLVEEVPESPERLQRSGDSPLSSPRLRLSPRMHELGAYADSSSSLGTPPPLFEEIKTEPIDMETMDYIKAEAELPTKPESLVKEECEEDLENELLMDVETSKHGWHTSDDESSTPTSDDDEEDDEDCFSDEQSFEDFKHSHKKRSSRLQCKVCGAGCTTRKLLRVHLLRFHPQEKPFACNLCTGTFKSSFLLAQHKLKHNRPDTMQCKMCGKYFRSQLHLQRHIKNFHLTSTYTCHICHEQFGNYTQMRFQYHVRQHGEKRFHCAYCAKAFHQKIHLINHERTHTKEQPFRCDYCGKTYRQQSACQEHMLTHQDPTPFKCKQCSKAFTQRSSLRLHMQRVHSTSGGNDGGGAVLRAEQRGQLRYTLERMSVPALEGNHFIDF